jgi:hypothetical protein
LRRSLVDRVSARHAACSFALGAVARVGAITFARVWVWIALAVWAVVLAAAIRRGFERFR